MEEFTGIYFDKYKEAGFYFPKSVLTTYALSLKTKPFVILAGISGTGKTKISQLFDVPLQTISTEKIYNEKMLITLHIPNERSRVNFPIQTLNHFLTADEIIIWNNKAEDAKSRKSEENFTDIYVIDIEDEFGGFQIGIYGQRASSPLLRVRFKKSNRDKTGSNYDSTEHIKKYYKPNDILQLEKIGNKKFKVESINGKEAISSQQIIDFETINRHCFIPVKSNWTDNTELLGYFNLIEKKYHIPKFLDFLLLANEYPEYPFFVTFDEMNLSKVEHYFSDILSCTESRYKEKDAIKQEAIILHNGCESIETDSEDFEVISNSIEIPKNLFITGTVNIDESTYSFSNKVLDRANVIEFNDVNLENYESFIDDDSSSFTLNKFPNFQDYQIPSKNHYNLLPEKIKRYLIEINDILKEYNLHFGYRTANEIGLYIQNAIECIGETEEIVTKALDYQLIQKVFPKLNGEYTMLEEPIRRILLDLSSKTDISSIDPDVTVFPNSIKKLLRMYDKLKKTGYTSFIE